MKKLLNERLREVKEGQSWLTVRPYGDHFIMRRQDAERLADEIERYYIPRPRFEDGKAAQFNDEFEDHNGNTQRISSLTYSKGATDYVRINAWSRFVLAEPLKRPTPKVYDADGVDIKVGDTVYFIDGRYEGASFEVMDFGVGVGLASIDGNKSVYIGCNTGTAMPEYLTHERPVFDAEGVRICKGDAVWDKRYNRVIVADLNSPCHPGCVSAFQNGEPPLTDYHPEELTHREPDSLERLRDDMRDVMTNSPDALFMDSTWVDRLTALIERGA